MSFADVLGDGRGHASSDASELLRRIDEWPQCFGQFARACVGLDRFDIAIEGLVKDRGAAVAEKKLWTIARGYGTDPERLRRTPRLLAELLEAYLADVAPGPRLSGPTEA